MEPANSAVNLPKTLSRPWKRPQAPTLRFTPWAWAKLLFLRDLGDTEVGGFGISAPQDLLLVEDVRLVSQTCTPVTVKFDDAAVADFFDEQIDAGRQPEQFGRIWVHTHPGESAAPSGVDEETFARCFGRADWTLMFILAKGGQTYARLRFNVGPGGSLQVPVEVDYGVPFPAADQAVWEQEYLERVLPEVFPFFDFRDDFSKLPRDAASPRRIHELSDDIQDDPFLFPEKFHDDELA